MTTTPDRAAGSTGVLIRAGHPGAADVTTSRTVTAAARPDDIVDQWGVHSFPASDPPANW